MNFVGEEAAFADESITGVVGWLSPPVAALERLLATGLETSSDTLVVTSRSLYGNSETFSGAGRLAVGVVSSITAFAVST